MRISRTAFAALAAVLAMACGKAVFTDAVAHRYGLTETDVRRIQFYTSDEIVLRRELSDQDKTLSGNELLIRDGIRVEEVVIPSRTPCVAVRIEGDFILASFSREHPDRSLWFTIKKTDQGEGPADVRRYELVQLTNPASEAGAFHPEYSKGFLVTYAGQKYRVVDGKMWGAHLLYDLDETIAKQRVRESPPGWKLSEGVWNPPASAAKLPGADAGAGK